MNAINRALTRFFDLILAPLESLGVAWALIVVAGLLMSNRKVRTGRHQLEDLTVEILARYGVTPPTGLAGKRVLE